MFGFFKKNKKEKSETKAAFEVKGSHGSAIRNEKEMAGIDKDVADNAFKTNKKILDEHLKTKGFCKHGTSTYVRLNSINVMEIINLQKECYGSKTFTVNISIMPLYLKRDHLVFAFGNRLGVIAADYDVWWDFATDEIAKISFENVIEAVDRFAIPWFESFCDQEYLKGRLSEDKKNGTISRYGLEWLDAVDSYDSSEEVIRANIEKLKLPKSFLKSIDR